MYNLFYNKLIELKVDISKTDKETIAERFTNSLEFISESKGFEDSRFKFYKDTGVFERHLYLDYGLKPVPNVCTVLKEMLDVAFELKTIAKINNKRELVHHEK